MPYATMLPTLPLWQHALRKALRCGMPTYRAFAHGAPYHPRRTLVL